MKREALFRVAIAFAVCGAILFLFRQYFGPNGLLYGDSNLQWDRSLLDAALAQLAHAWAPAFGGGRPSIIINSTTSPLTLLQTAVSFAGIPLSTMLIYPVLLCVGYAGCWIAARKISENAVSAHAVAIFFIGNPWIWDRILLGHIGILAAAVITPWTLATIVYRGTLRNAFVPLVFAECGIMLWCDARVSYMFFIGLVILGAVWIASSIRYRRPLQTFEGLGLLACPIAALLLNAWWTLPFLQLSGITPVRPFFPPLEDVLSYSRYADFVHNVVFSGSFLHFSWDRAAAHGALAFVCWYAATLAVLIAAFCSNTTSRTLNVILRFGIVASLLISMGTALVPPGATLWIYANVPMSAFFRDPNKLAFIAVLCIVLLLSVRLRTASPGWRWALMAAIAISVLPTLSGDLRTTDGTGLQPFAERSNFVDVLDFLTARRGFPDFRVALIPPWAAEVSLKPGEHPVAEPFVFQYRLPTMDAKLINTASDMSMSSWRVFEDLYAGTDTHPDRSLARLGVKYLIWDDSATLSAGAANTPFFNVANLVVKRALDDANFHEVYRSGSLHVLENPAFEGLMRGVAGPVVDGAIPEHVRAVLPASAIGDAVEAVDTQHRGWPFSTMGVGSSARDACLSRTPHNALLLAYDRVSAHSDWKTYWVDSDYLQQGTGDAVLSRQLANYPLPYAFTASNAAISFALDVPAGSRIAVEGSVLAEAGRVDYAIDGGRWKPLHLPAGVLGWTELEAGAAGRHLVSVRGSRVGTLIRAVTAALPQSCAGTYLSERPFPAAPFGGMGWVVPSPFSALTLKENGGKFSFEARNIALNAVSVSERLRAHAPIDGPGADGLLLDHLTTPIGVPFNVLLGYHRAEFFAKGAPITASAWTHLFKGTPTGESGSATFRFNARYSEEGASTTLFGIAPGSVVLLQLPFQGAAAGAEVRIFQSGLILARYSLSSTAAYLTMPAYGDNIQIAVRREHATDSLVLEPPQAFSGVAIGESVLDLPDRAVRAPPGPLAYTRDGGHVTRLSLFSDNRALVSTGKADPYTVVQGAQGLLAYSGLSSSINTRCTLTITYEGAGGPVTRGVADADVGNGVGHGRISVPILPRTTAVLPRFDCANPNAVLRLASAELTFTASPEMGMLLTIPSTAPASANPAVVSHVILSPEEFRISGHPANVVSLSNFDPAWQFGSNEHFIVNGSENGWIDSGGDRIVYTIQREYRKDITISLWLWSLLGLSIVAALVLNRRPPREHASE
ncbi:MAG TPA: hypothetical protein VMS32_10150 [Verrucomicrobiae bacterium]|jgi:hypothetical protein|nr:hypothetical protein [Verrucomicrobiae bacterium]